MAKILLVEDDTSLRTAYGMILTTKKYHVETASNGREALAKLKTFDPDLILLDLLMPLMSGVEFLEKYHPTDKNKANILLMTNMPSSPEVDRSIKLGARAAVTKSSLTPTGLLDLVNEHIKNRG